MLQMQTGVPVSSRGVMELVCALFGSDSVNHTQRAIVPLNVVWVQPFRFRQLVAGRRMYQVSKVPGPGDVLIASSACSILPKHRDRGHCFALPHFPLQSWRGVLPFQSLVPSKSCVYLPVTRLMQHIVTENPDENRYGPSVSVPCPPQPVRLLRWYDRGELWGRLTERTMLSHATGTGSWSGQQHPNSHTERTGSLTCGDQNHRWTNAALRDVRRGKFAWRGWKLQLVLRWWITVYQCRNSRVPLRRRRIADPCWIQLGRIRFGTARESAHIASMSTIACFPTLTRGGIVAAILWRGQCLHALEQMLPDIGMVGQ